MAIHNPPPAPQSPSKANRLPSKPRNAFVKFYLLAYNSLSALAWSYVLLLVLVHIFNLDYSTPHTVAPQTASSTLTRILASLPFIKSSGYIAPLGMESRIPPYLQPLYRRTTMTYARVGTLTAFVQSVAVLEVLHILLGWVRSPLQTTVAQVSSRLFLVWGITEQFDAARVSPLYTSMVLAWSATEVIRYSFYACNVAGYEPYFLLYLRYTTFYLLYPIGAGSEAFLIYSILPRSSPVPSWQSWVQGMWKPTDYVRALLFAIWWPGLYVMYTYMIQQRRKVLGRATGHTLGSKPKAL